LVRCLGQYCALTFRRRGDLLKLALSRSQQVMAPAGTLGGHQWIAAGDQPSARIGRVANLGEVALIER